jgi:tetratricopeptide (TPR) repeat protein
MQFKKAAEEYCSIIITAPEQANSVKSRIMSYINKPGALEQTISVVESQDNDNINVESLLASLYKEARNYHKAFELYKEIESMQNNQGGELISFARYLFTEKRFSKSAEVYNYIISHYAGSPFIANAKLGYAKTLQASLENDSLILKQNWKPYFIPPDYPQEKIDEIVSAYSDIIKLYPKTEVGNEAYLNIGNLYFERMNNPAEAEKYYHRLISLSPNSPIVADAYLQLGNISIKKGNLDEAVITFNKVLSFKRTGSDKKNIARYHLAKIDFYKGEFDNAKNILGEIIDDLEDNTANDALELSLLLNTAKNDSVDLRKFADADLLKAQKKFSKAESIYEEISQNPRAFILNNIAGIRSAEMDIATDSLNKAISKLSKITGEREKNIYSDKALYLEARIYQFGLKNAPEAIKTYQVLLADFPNSIYLDEARKNINTLKNKTS